jgi:DNA-binding transcriptional MerR regulator
MGGHGAFLARDVAEMTGVPGTTVGQWARRGLIRSSQRDEEPRLYSVEDVAEAAIVRDLLGAGVRHADIHRAIAALPGHWPLSSAELAVLDGGALARREGDALEVLGPGGWRFAIEWPPARDVRLRLSRSAS